MKCLPTYIQKYARLMSHSQRMSEDFQVVSADFSRDQARCSCSLEQLKKKSSTF